MGFLVDECTGPKVARWLEEEGHEVYSVYDESRGMADEDVIRLANDKDHILITNDKDFGELVFRLNMPHRGIILLRLEDERSENKITVLEKLLKQHPDDLPNNFVVVTERTVRVIRGRPGDEG